MRNINKMRPFPIETYRLFSALADNDDGTVLDSGMKITNSYE